MKYLIFVLLAFSLSVSYANDKETLIEKGIKTKCSKAEDQDACRTTELEDYMQLIKYINEATTEFKIQSVKIEKMLKSFKELNRKDKEEYLYARFKYGMISGCKIEAVKEDKVYPSNIQACIKKYEPYVKKDSIDMVDGVDFKFDGRTDNF